METEGRRWRGTYPCLLGGLLAPLELLETVVALLLEVGLALLPRLVEAVDDGVLALGHEDTLHLVRRLGVCSSRPRSARVARGVIRSRGEREREAEREKGAEREKETVLPTMRWSLKET